MNTEQIRQSFIDYKAGRISLSDAMTPFYTEGIKANVKYWACVSSRGFVLNSTVKSRKKDSIAELVKDTSETWEYWKYRHGWRCIQVDIRYFPIIKKQK